MTCPAQILHACRVANKFGFIGKYVHQSLSYCLQHTAELTTAASTLPEVDMALLPSVPIPAGQCDVLINKVLHLSQQMGSWVWSGFQHFMELLPQYKWLLIGAGVLLAAGIWVYKSGVFALSTVPFTSCVVCYERGLEWIYPNCGHLCVCGTCAQTTLVCPICQCGAPPIRVYIQGIE